MTLPMVAILGAIILFIYFTGGTWHD